MTDGAPKREDMPYRPCVGIMVLNGEGEVWVGHRKVEIDDENDGSQMLWQMPQGGIDEGEEPLQAAYRELYEETGMRSVTLVGEAPDWLTYELPDTVLGTALKGRYRGQKQRWFAFRFEGEESEIAVNPPPDGHPTEFDSWSWTPMRRVPELIVPFKRPVYEEVVAVFAPLAGA
ncbi:RNA pyrophosphohydrolase [Pararhizobium mangrovi]|uniref:RNA pyrophosphohydrolase n=1 Tax=Pararhizobium mangrovi TaxID=2590452 RepID=A0A506TZX6_9HYPH|nr:RNA pyrophosphohydrolase [Pararhizobium mangrovi]TPW26521.1 RNA pyrophosphohydrolase [Pararhizobium mangrovi]